MRNMLYTVSFHTRSPNGNHTFYFTDYDMAISFGISLQMHPKVLDATIFEMEANIAAEYDRLVKDPNVRELDSWERGPRMRGVVKEKGNQQSESNQPTTQEGEQAEVEQTDQTSSEQVDQANHPDTNEATVQQTYIATSERINEEEMPEGDTDREEMG